MPSFGHFRVSRGLKLDQISFPLRSVTIDVSNTLFGRHPQRRTKQQRNGPPDPHRESILQFSIPTQPVVFFTLAE
jgi:hypothetical protein